MRLQRVLEKYLPLIGNMLAPALLLTIGMFVFLLHDGLLWTTASRWHEAFYVFGLITTVLALHFNRARPLFWVAVVTVSYVLINNLKMQNGADFQQNISFNTLIAALPFNLLLLYVGVSKRLFGRRSVAFLLLLLAEYTLGEWASRLNISVAFVYGEINITAIIGFVLLIGWSFALAAKDGEQFDYTILVTSISLAFGIYYADMPSGLSLFFGMAQVVMCGTFIYHLIYNFVYDEQTGVLSHSAYHIQSRHFPSKYTLSLIRIDNYDKLAKGLGRKRLSVLTALVSDIVVDHLTDEKVYRYAADQFVVIYNRLDKKETFEATENIRRAIAGVGFALGRHQKPIKLTVSCSVADKKRSDANAVEVLARAEKAMRDTLKFSLNVTSQG